MTNERPEGLPGKGFWARAAVLVLVRPSLWSTALAQAHRLARPRWWTSAPYLPLPDRAYLRFRFETQYGSAGRPAPHDLVAYLEWCRDGGNPARTGGRSR